MTTKKSETAAFFEELSFCYKTVMETIIQAGEILSAESIPEEVKDIIEEKAVTCSAILQKYGACLRTKDEENFHNYMHQINLYMENEMEFVFNFLESLNAYIKDYFEGPVFSEKNILNPSNWKNTLREQFKKIGTFVDSEEALKEKELAKYETPFVIVIIQAFIEYLDALMEYASMVAKFPNLTGEAIFFVRSSQIEIKEIQQDYMKCLMQEYVETLQISQGCIVYEINILHKHLSVIEVKFDQYLVYSDDTPEISIRSDPKFFIGETMEC